MWSLDSYSFNNSALIGFFHEKEVSFKNGILEVRLLKTEEAKAKEVKVKMD